MTTDRTLVIYKGEQTYLVSFVRCLCFNSYSKPIYWILYCICVAKHCAGLANHETGFANPDIVLPKSLSSGEGWMICNFSNISVHFAFCSLNFIVIFPFLIKYSDILFIIIVFWLGCDRPSGLLLFVPALLLSILTPLFLPSSSVSLSYFVLAVPMRECLGKHSCMSSPCPIAILNGTFLFSRGEIVCNLGRSFVYQNQIKLY